MLSSRKLNLASLLLGLGGFVEALPSGFIPSKIQKEATPKPRRGHSGDKLARKAAKGLIGIRKHW